MKLRTPLLIAATIAVFMAAVITAALLIRHSPVSTGTPNGSTAVLTQTTPGSFTTPNGTSTSPSAVTTTSGSAATRPVEPEQAKPVSKTQAHAALSKAEQYLIASVHPAATAMPARINGVTISYRLVNRDVWLLIKRSTVSAAQARSIAGRFLAAHGETLASYHTIRISR